GDRRLRCGAARLLQRATTRTLGAMERRAYVRGKVRGGKAAVFEGHITVELRNDSVYYTWKVQAPEGMFLGEKSQPVSLRAIPAGQEPLAFALEHAVAGINKYRVNRVPCFE